MQPWEVDPDGPPRVLTLAELLIGLQHFGVDWLHATNLQYLGYDGAPDGPPRDGIMLAPASRASLPLPAALAFAVRFYEKELTAIADVRHPPCDLPWRVPPPPVPSPEESARTLREFRVSLWLDELSRERAERRKTEDLT